MALLCGGIDRDRIRMLGRWRTNAMFIYLHLQAEPIMRRFGPSIDATDVGGKGRVIPMMAAPGQQTLSNIVKCQQPKITRIGKYRKDATSGMNQES
jgi:hypothetical protein